MIKKIVIIFMLFVVFFGITGCSRDSEKASYNVSKEADNFKTKRRIVFINLRTDSYLFEIIGNCSITTDNTDDQLEVICKVGEDKYQKHFLRMTTEVTYTVEQLDYSEVSKYDYEITFKPEAIVPIKIKTED